MSTSQKFPRCLTIVLALLVATTNAETDNDVPGCACQANSTCGTTDTSTFSDILACSLIQRSDPPYRFQGAFEQPVAICDGLEADPEFQQAVGNESRSYYFNRGGRDSIGPYYETGFVAMQVGYGTCQDMIAKQNSCPIDATGSDDQDDDFSTGNSFGLVKPNSCTSFRLTLPTTNSTLDVSSTCESWISPEKNITGGHEDSIVLYAVLGRETDISDHDLCDADMTSEYVPALTRADWIEPKANSSRRYFSHDIMDVDGTEYCLLVVSIGNEPCRGPPPPSSSSRTTNGRHVVLFLLVGQLAFAVLSWAF